jgi:DNA-binding CsgD family transcriptional regulator
MQRELILQEIERAGSTDELSRLLHHWRDELGLSHLVYHALSVPAFEKSNALLLLTYDKAWVQHYVQRDYFQIDPVVRAGRAGFLPLDWMAVDHHTKEARQFFAEAASYGVGRHGITLSIRGPAGERALFTINADVNDEHWHRWRLKYVHEVQLLAHYFHDRAMRVAGLRDMRTLRPLAARERQCLEGIARGQAPGQIASELNVSLSAVHAYLRSVRMKLESTTVEQAIAKAIRLDIIS